MRIADEAGHRLANVAGTLQSEQPVRRPVHPQDGPGVVEDDGAVRHRLRRLLEPHHDLAQALLALAVLAVDPAQRLEHLGPDSAGGGLGSAAAAREPEGKEVHAVDVP